MRTADNDKRNGLNGKEPLPAKGGAGEGHAQASDDASDHQDSSIAARPAGGRVAKDPERTCVLSGKKAPRESLIRLALGPDGTVAPDIRAKAPGRGAWIAVDRKALEEAITKGKLSKALSRAFKTAVNVPADLADQIEKALERAALDRLGLEARAGQIITGTEKIVDAARKGTVELLLHAYDAAADGTRKLDQALRVGLDLEGSDVRGLAIPATRAILSMALGRENVVHLALIAPAAAARVNQALGRWRGFIGLDG
jgi:uncharacterized protein